MYSGYQPYVNAAVVVWQSYVDRWSIGSGVLGKNLSNEGCREMGIGRNITNLVSLRPAQCDEYDRSRCVVVGRVVVELMMLPSQARPRMRKAAGRCIFSPV